MKIHLYRFPFDFPFAKDPEWSSKVDRWYQLDAAAFGLTELVWNLKDKPDLIFLGSQDASGTSDKLFVQSDATSAVRFAHTLPNVRCSPFLQAKGWSLPVFCSQYGNSTLSNAVCNAQMLLGNSFKKIWILSVLPDQKTPGKYNACALELNDATREKTSEISIADTRHSVFNGPDREILTKLEQVLCKQEAFTLIDNRSV